MVLGNPICALANGAAMLLASRLIVRTDHNMFKIRFMFTKTKGQETNTTIWGGSAYSRLTVAEVKRAGLSFVFKCKAPFPLLESYTYRRTLEGDLARSKSKCNMA